MPATNNAVRNVLGFTGQFLVAGGALWLSIKYHVWGSPDHSMENYNELKTALSNLGSGSATAVENK